MDVIDSATRIADLPNGLRPIGELAAEHAGWVRKIDRQDGDTTFYERTPAEEHIRHLGLLATQLRYENPDEAVEALRRQRALARLTGGDLGQATQWWLRLPKYLHSAGRLPEAIAELEGLIDESMGVVNATFAHQDAGARERLLSARLDPIYDFLALVLAENGEKERAKEARAKAARCRWRYKSWLRREEKERRPCSPT